MPVDIKLDYTLVEHERVVLAADPTVTTKVFNAEGCQSVTLIKVYESAATADAAIETITEGDLEDGSDQAASTVTPFTYPEQNVGESRVVRFLEFKPAKRYFQVSFAGVASSEFVELIVVKQNCYKPGVGSQKPLVEDGLRLQSIECMIPSDC